MKVSVAMCTYNGARYIQEQLDSILHQTRPVDEIIISDDGSTDGTLEILRKYANDYHYINYCVNKTNKGFKQNFIDTINRCTGDIVFLSDQDDCWYEYKVAKILDLYEKNANLQVVFTNGNIINEDGESLNETMFERVGLDNMKQQFWHKGYALEILARCNRATGATMAMRKSFVNNIDWMKYTKIKYHDLLLVLLSIGSNQCDFMNDCLIKYRLHSGNNTGLDRFQEFYISPLVPVKDIDKSILEILDLSQKQRLNFASKRMDFTHYWFGIQVMSHINIYRCVYGIWWYKFLLYDWKDSNIISTYRIRNKWRSVCLKNLFKL